MDIFKTILSKLDGKSMVIILVICLAIVSYGVFTTPDASKDLPVEKEAEEIFKEETGVDLEELERSIFKRRNS